MKKVLVIDESTLFRDFLKQKLEEFGLEVVVGVNGLDGAAKLRREIPDLVIMEYNLSRLPASDLLEAKTQDPNTAGVPVIIATGKLDRKKLIEIARFNVKKIFTKPVRVDSLLQTVSSVLSIRLEVDSTPCIIEAHFNEEILFVEVAQGLNREKVELLRYKIAELLELYAVNHPPVLVIMSSIDPGPDDSVKLGSLLVGILDATGSRPRQVKILTSSPFVREFVAGRKEYAGIEVTDNLEHAMDGLLGSKAAEFLERQREAPADRRPPAGRPSSPPVVGQKGEQSIEIRFSADRQPFDLRESEATAIAVVDDDFIIREMVKAVFSDTGIEIREYENGRRFFDDPAGNDVDLVLLDLMMPEMDGFQVMAEMRRQGRSTPVCVLSALSRRETVVKALNYGISSYLSKPLNPEAILNKAREILKASF